MNRQIATKSLRDLLDSNNLTEWHIRLTSDVTKPFLGMCSYKDQTIILNAHHLDTHPDEEILNTIRHEVAHALTPSHQHDTVWAECARKLGCDNTSPCASYGFDARAIDAIRSGADLVVTFETETVRKPKYTINRLQDKCEVCGKVAKVKFRKEFKIKIKDKFVRKVAITLECFHIQIKDADSSSDFDEITFDGIPTCSHVWGIGKSRTLCTKCNAKRLYEYQIEGARSLERSNGRMAIFDEMGLGKTIQALAYLKFHPEAFPFLWITKSGIKFQHAKEIIRILGVKSFPQILTSGKEILFPTLSVIASYDIFRRMDIEMFINHKFQAVIIDECQAIKNPDSSRTSCIRQIVKHIPRIIPLSGTPWKNRGSEFFVVLNMLDPKRFWSYKAFKDQWVDTYFDGAREKEGGIRNPKKFKEYISDLAIRRERTEVMPELPLINRTRLISQVPDYARKEYNVERDNLIRNYQDSVLEGREDGIESQRQMMQSLMIMRQIIGIAKVPATVEFASEFLEDTDRKLVIFVHHKKCGELILSQMTEYCANENLPKPLSLVASMDSAERSETCDKFNGPNYRLMIASTLASGEGLNLQTCSDMILHERQWNPANEQQAEGRFIRIGQQAQSVNATYVHGDDTIDTIMDSIVETKRKSFHIAMNNGQMETWNEQSIIKELVQSIISSKGNGKSKER